MVLLFVHIVYIGNAINAFGFEAMNDERQSRDPTRFNFDVPFPPSFRLSLSSIALRSISYPLVSLMYSSVLHTPTARRQGLSELAEEEDVDSPSIYSPQPVSPSRRPLPEPGQSLYQPLTLDIDADDPYADSYARYAEPRAESVTPVPLDSEDYSYQQHEPHTSVDMHDEPAIAPVYDGHDDGYVDEKAGFYPDVQYIPRLDGDAGSFSSLSGASLRSSDEVVEEGENLHYGPLPERQTRRNKALKKVKLTKGHLVSFFLF
jgi:hypothetical protein